MDKTSLGFPTEQENMGNTIDLERRQIDVD